MAEKFSSTFRSRYVNNHGQIRVHDNLPTSFSKITAFFIIFFNSVLQVIIKLVLFLCKNSSVDVSSDGKLSDLECFIYYMLLINDQDSLDVFCNCLKDSATLFGMHFTISGFQVPLRGWIGFKLNFVLAKRSSAKWINFIILAVTFHFVVTYG